MSGKSQDIYEFNLLTSTLTEDLINAVNIPLINFRGDMKRLLLSVEPTLIAFPLQPKQLLKIYRPKTLVRS